MMRCMKRETEHLIVSVFLQSLLTLILFLSAGLFFENSLSVWLRATGFVIFMSLIVHIIEKAYPQV